MEEIIAKTHLIVTDVHEEYHINWCGQIINTNPQLKNGLPIFIVVGGKGRTEINTVDMNRIEKVAKLLTKPKGRKAVTSDTARIYIKEKDGKETLMGVLTHNHIKKYAPMYDTIGYKI